MPFDWTTAFSQGAFPWKGADGFDDIVTVSSLARLKVFLDEVHIKYCLLRPYFETERYPLVESRDLLPSFETELWEYKNLPGFSLVAFQRPMESFNEIFQYDIMHPLSGESGTAEGASCPLEAQVSQHNLHTLMARLAKRLQGPFRERFHNMDTSLLDYYPSLLPYLLTMDRAQVMALDPAGQFYLSGVFASFPSDIDGELKRFGLRIGKFKLGDHHLYERNRLFVYQFLMELYGFPVASERRTSAALFARRLHKVGEQFMVRVLGQSDRTLTTIWNQGENRHYPQVEKVALTRIDPEQTELVQTLDKLGYFVDRKKLVVILRVNYKQHRFSSDNVRQDRALSVADQEIIHPLTGKTFGDVNVIRDSSTMILRLNDIVRGEYVGRVVYKRTEIVENTETTEKQLKFLYAWLAKNQRRIIGYSDDFYASVTRILDSYLRDVDCGGKLLAELHQEVHSKYAYIRQARQVRYLEDISARHYKGERLSYAQMLQAAVDLLHDLKFDLVNYFDVLVENILHDVQRILDDRYLLRSYVECDESGLSKRGLEIRKNYRKLVSLNDEFRSIRKARAKNK